jgi:hypothetical protein
MDVAERTRVELPGHIPPEFEVYVNGVRQERGRDYTLEGRSLVFPRPLAQEGKLGFWRWLWMWLGVVGSYRKHETVDLAYESAGSRHVETGLRPEPFD